MKYSVIKMVQTWCTLCCYRTTVYHFLKYAIPKVCEKFAFFKPCDEGHCWTLDPLRQIHHDQVWPHNLNFFKSLDLQFLRFLLRFPLELFRSVLPIYHKYLFKFFSDVVVVVFVSYLENSFVRLFLLSTTLINDYLMLNECCVLFVSIESSIHWEVAGLVTWRRQDHMKVQNLKNNEHHILTLFIFACILY